MMTDESYYERRHTAIARPTVRVRTERAGGSGTVLFSENGSTYVLTNEHVVSGAISIEKRWSTLLKSERKIDVFDPVSVEFFEYQYSSRAIGGTSVQSDIVAYDKDEDLALLKLRGTNPAPAVATLLARGEENNLRVGMPVIAVGAGLGEPPVQTQGYLSQFGMEIDRREFWLNTAPSIFGNSGGALFLADEDRFEFIGVPARISVAMLGWSADAITHLSYAIPVTRVYSFLEDQMFRFIYDDTFTEEGEEQAREALRKREEEKMAMASADAPSMEGGALITPAIP